MPKLTSSEIQEIHRCLAEGKTLPDKYRFLLFGDKREVELVWNGKAATGPGPARPFLTVERVDRAREEKPDWPTLANFRADESHRPTDGWRDKLIRGDNKLILSSLKNGPISEEIETQGGLKLIYIDPPFDLGADYSLGIGIGEGTLNKKPERLEKVAYRDSWGKGADSFISMMYERLLLMHDLLANDGSIYVHIGTNISHYIKILLDEIFGPSNYRSEIVWRRSNSHNKLSGQYGPIHDVIFFYSKSADYQFHPLRTPLSSKYIKARFKYQDKNGIYQPNYLTGAGIRNGHSGQPWHGFNPTSVGRHWAIPSTVINKLNIDAKKLTTQTILDKALEADLLYIPKKSGGQPMYKQYLTDGVLYQDIWAYQPNTNGVLYNTNGCIDQDVKWLEQESEALGYDTQKPEGLLRRIIETSSNPNDLVADFFCGSGTTAAVAEKLGRKWIVADMGQLAIHTTKKRLLSVQRELKKANDSYRAFEVLELGHHEGQRRATLGPEPGALESLGQLEPQAAGHEAGSEAVHKAGQAAGHEAVHKAGQAAGHEAGYGTGEATAFAESVLKAYEAARAKGLPTSSAKDVGRLIVVTPGGHPVTKPYLEGVISAATKSGFNRVVLLAFEFDKGLFPAILDEAKSRGLELYPKYIPLELLYPGAAGVGQLHFGDLAHIDVKTHFRGNKVAVELTNYSIIGAQENLDGLEASLKKGASQVVTHQGQVVKVSKDKSGRVSHETLTNKWTDWVDYWAVDFDFGGERECLAVNEPSAGAQEGNGSGKVSGKVIFNNLWQTFRTNKNRSLEIKSVYHDYDVPPNGKEIAIKVVDILGNENLGLLEVGLDETK
ncbi:MAG: site-specific DNA-methyltransferase [Deltaproteobacteria bacterium]|jgi:DNA modification methylase|nr:site-specific DNA-methyltransferase [Deltaproteobacteria bacterium]